MSTDQDFDLQSLQTEDNRPTATHITVRISKNYHREPVISHLISDYGLIVNITAAILGENAQDDGWFNLELRGTDRQIQAALAYLDALDMEVWSKSNADEENW